LTPTALSARPTVWSTQARRMSSPALDYSYPLSSTQKTSLCCPQLPRLCGRNMDEIVRRVKTLQLSWSPLPPGQLAQQTFRIFPWRTVLARPRSGTCFLLPTVSEDEGRALPDTIAVRSLPISTTFVLSSRKMSNRVGMVFTIKRKRVD
jgi:hypothetical protein